MEVDKSQVQKAVTCLNLLLKEKATEDFLNNPQKILLQLNFKKIPSVKNQIIKLNLPHGLKTDNQFVCIFVKDLDKTNRDFTDTVMHFKELFSEKGIDDISEIIPVKSLKIMYKPYEAKRKLSNSFDLHLADSRIVRFLPQLLGKHFFSRKRHPIQVDLTANNLKGEIDRAMNNSRCIISGRGSACTAVVANTKQTTEEIVENIVSAAQQLSQKIPGGEKNVQALYIKTEKSTSFLIYLSLDSSNDVELPITNSVEEEIEPEDVTTVENGKVKVYLDGTVKVIDDDSPQAQKRKSESNLKIETGKKKKTTDIPKATRKPKEKLSTMKRKTKRPNTKVKKTKKPKCA